MLTNEELLVISEIKLIKSAYLKTDLIRDYLPKFVFVGRSNVGKSSFLNSLCGIKKLARVASTPGKTVSINYYLVNKRFYFIDLPGYGYAKIPKKEQHRIRELMSLFFDQSINIKLVFLLIDARRGFMPIDAGILEVLIEKKYSLLTILTKSDKLSFSGIKNQQKKLFQDFELKVIPFSIKSKNNIKEIYQNINFFLME